MAKKRNGAVDFWRFVFSVILVIFHTHVLDVNGAYPDYPFPMHLGSLAVEFFLLTSGFLMAKSLNKPGLADGLSWEGTWRFIKGKLLSFYPAFVICWVITFIARTAVTYVDLRDLAVRLGRSVFELTLLRNAGFNTSRVLPQAWYLSSMILVMFLLYPLYAKNRRRFEHYIAPVIAAAVIGYLCIYKGSLLNPSKELEFTFKGNLRVLGEICLGVVCHSIYLRLREVDFTRLGRVLLGILELLGYVLSILFMQFYEVFPNYLQFAALFMLAVSVIITFSEKSFISPLFDHAIFNVLGRYSLYPYLLYSMYAYTLQALLPDMSMDALIWLYLGLTFATAALVMAVHTLCSKRFKEYKQRRKAVKEAGANE